MSQTIPDFFLLMLVVYMAQGRGRWTFWLVLASALVCALDWRWRWGWGHSSRRQRTCRGWQRICRWRWSRKTEALQMEKKENEESYKYPNLRWLGEVLLYILEEQQVCPQIFLLIETSSCWHSETTLRKKTPPSVCVPVCLAVYCCLSVRDTQGGDQCRVE